MQPTHNFNLNLRDQGSYAICKQQRRHSLGGLIIIIELVEFALEATGEVKLKPVQQEMRTEDSRPSGSFFTQMDHLFLANGFSKPVTVRLKLLPKR